MGNVMFNCCSPCMNTVRVNQRRRSSCWFLALLTEKRLSVGEESSSSYQGSNSGSFSQTICTTRSKKRRSYLKSSPTSKVSVSSPSEDYRESLLHPRRGRSYEHCPNSFYSSLTGNSFPKKLIRKSPNQHCSQERRVNSSSSRYSPTISSSPDHMSSPASRPSLTGDSSVAMKRESFNHYCDQQRSEHRSTSRSSALSGLSRDLKRMYFNQHCYQQLHPASSLKQFRSPRKNSKVGSGKTGIRKRTAVRFPAHRSTTFTSPGRAPNGFKYIEDKKYEMRSLSHVSPNIKTLATILRECNEENDDKRNAMASPYIRTSSSTSPGRTADGRKGDSSRRYTKFYNGLAAVERAISSPISRKAALTLIKRQKLYACRKYSISSEEHARRRHWKPALESISEVIDREPC